MSTTTPSSLRRPSRLAAATLAAALLTASATSARAEPPTPDPDPDPWFGSDKALHFGAGFGLAAGGYGFGAWAFEDRWSALAFGAGLTVALGAGKEGLDAAGLGEASWKDFVWDLVGGTLGLGVALSFDAALRGPEPSPSASR